MPIVIPPSQPKAAKGSVWQQFVNKWAKKYPAFKDNAPDIAAAAKDAKIDPIYFASVLLEESGADYNTNPSDKGALGIGQLMPSSFVGTSAPWDPTHVITKADLLAPTTNLRLSAYYLAQQIGSYGYAHAYGGDPSQASGGYNHGAGNLPQKFVDAWNKSYVYVTPSTSPPGSAGKQVPGGTGQPHPDNSVDRWAVLGADGKVKFTHISDPTKAPANVLKYGSTPLTQSAFLQTWKQQYADTYFAYTGHQASGKQIASILKNAPSVYTLSNALAKTPAFQTSPTYKAHAPGVIGVAKSMFGDDWKPDKSFVAKAIAQNWDQATLETNLRARPEYESGPQFKDNIAKLSNVYQGIYGNVTPAASKAMTNLARLGWTQDQVAAWLRQMPEYKSSQEYKSRALSFAQQLGLITGQMPTLTADQASLGGPPQTPTATPTGAPAPVPASVSGTYPPPVPVRPDDRAGVRGV